MTPTEALAQLADAIRDAMPVAYAQIPVYVNPLDSVEAPCVLVLGGDMTPASLGGVIEYETRVVAVGYRLDVDGGHTLVDDVAVYAVAGACNTLSPAGWTGARPPATYTIAGVDYIGRESTVTIRFDPSP